MKYTEYEYRVTYEDGHFETVWALTMQDALRQVQNAQDELEFVHDLTRSRVTGIEEQGKA